MPAGISSCSPSRPLQFQLQPLAARRPPSAARRLRLPQIRTARTINLADGGVALRPHDQKRQETVNCKKNTPYISWGLVGSIRFGTRPTRLVEADWLVRLGQTTGVENLSIHNNKGAIYIYIYT
jgi:hypothetical protein